MSLLINAVESISVGVEDYLMDDSRRYLSAVRNICAGILLLYKEKLYRLSPQHGEEVLIKKDIRPIYDNEGNIIFIGKGNKTVDVQEIKERFKTLKIIVEWGKFDELSQLRNEIEHYYTDKSPDVVREVVAKSFILIRDFISEYLQEDPLELLGDKCWQALLKTAEVYQGEEEACRKSFEKINWKYTALEESVHQIRCPDCHSSLIKTEDEGDYHLDTSLFCSYCGYNFVFEEVIEQCLSDGLRAKTHTAIKEGDQPPLGTCPDCYRDTYLIAEDCCTACGYKREYCECEMCGTTLSLDEQDLEGLCSGCQNGWDKAMAE